MSPCELIELDEINLCFRLPSSKLWQERRFIPLPPEAFHYFDISYFYLDFRGKRIVTKYAFWYNQWGLFKNIKKLFPTGEFFPPQSMLRFTKGQTGDISLSIVTPESLTLIRDEEQKAREKDEIKEKLKQQERDEDSKHPLATEPTTPGSGIFLGDTRLLFGIGSNEIRNVFDVSLEPRKKSRRLTSNIANFCPKCPDEPLQLARSSSDLQVKVMKCMKCGYEEPFIPANPNKNNPKISKDSRFYKFKPVPGLTGGRPR
ncbi:MAG: hypothetical protein RBG13Loki_2141 [Promethearchaeota archaeon CR_4]|nr:MAG: hypothetical protein RBG13Loki_2141 [Candidatus Lokiarchaeota archaeon CR_4]